MPGNGATDEKQLLGTETVQLLRADGVKCKICGLSANELEDAFTCAGADAFMLKPIPGKASVLKNNLYEILHGNRVMMEKGPRRLSI
jgi:hypothetical protein